MPEATTRTTTTRTEPAGTTENQTRVQRQNSVTGLLTRVSERLANSRDFERRPSLYGPIIAISLLGDFLTELSGRVFHRDRGGVTVEGEHENRWGPADLIFLAFMIIELALFYRFGQYRGHWVLVKAVASSAVLNLAAFLLLSVGLYLLARRGIHEVTDHFHDDERERRQRMLAAFRDEGKSPWDILQLYETDPVRARESVGRIIGAMAAVEGDNANAKAKELSEARKLVMEAIYDYSADNLRDETVPPWVIE